MTSISLLNFINRNWSAVDLLQMYTKTET